MAMKLDPGSSAEPQSVQSSIAMSTTAVSVSSPKISKFGSKAGFVIPKNKLSGSLIPIFRGGGKVEAGITDKEEDTKHIQRKTKWGPDLTQDATVGKGRALAYQTRVEQITQQLKSGALEIGDDQDLQSPAQPSNHNSRRDLLDAEPQKHDLLELERREIIGEILLLNPSYKAPPDYKPLLKEAKVPIPLKTYPGYNFIGLILGPDNDTQKRLEKETGTKVRVLGTKAAIGEKREIAHSDITDARASYEDVYVHVSADTYEKVDAAVSLIELLFAPVSANSVVASTTTSSAAVDSGSISDPSQDSTSGYTMMSMGAINHGVAPQMVMPVQAGPQQFQAYSGPWFPPSAPNAPIRPPLSGFITPPMPNHSLQFPPSPGNPLNAPTFFGGRPPVPIPRNPSPFMFRHQPPMQVLQRPLNQGPPSNLSMPSMQAPLVHPTMPPPQPHSTPSQTLPMAPGGFPPNRPLSTSMPLRNPWSTVPPSAPQSQRPSSMMQMPSNQPMGPPQRPHLHLTVPQSSVASVPSPPNFLSPSISRPLATNFTPPPAFPSQPYSSGPPQAGALSIPAMVTYSVKPLAPSVSGPTFLPSHAPSPVPRQLPISAPLALVSTSDPVSAQSSVPSIRPPQLAPPSNWPPQPAPPPILPPQPAPAMPGSALGGLPSFSPLKPSPASPGSIPSAPKPQPPSSGDFTFQPLRAQTPFSPTSSGTNPSQVLLAAPLAPSYRPAVQNIAIPAGVQTYLTPQTVSQRGPLPPPPPRALIAASSPASVVPRPMNSPTGGPPPRHTLYPNPQHVSPLVQANPPSFIPVRVPTLMQPPNQVPTSQPHGLLGPSQQMSYMANKLDSSHGGNQSYDPFSPTSVSSSSAPRQQADEQTKVRKMETDAEYEDLMASVGVR